MTVQIRGIGKSSVSDGSKQMPRLKSGGASNCPVRMQRSGAWKPSEGAIPREWSLAAKAFIGLSSPSERAERWFAHTFAGLFPGGSGLSPDALDQKLQSVWADDPISRAANICLGRRVVGRRTDEAVLQELESALALVGQQQGSGGLQSRVEQALQAGTCTVESTWLAVEAWRAVVAHNPLVAEDRGESLLRSKLMDAIDNGDCFIRKHTSFERKHSLSPEVIALCQLVSLSRSCQTAPPVPVTPIVAPDLPPATVASALQLGDPSEIPVTETLLIACLCLLQHHPHEESAYEHLMRSLEAHMPCGHGAANRLRDRRDAWGAVAQWLIAEQGVSGAIYESRVLTRIFDVAMQHISQCAAAFSPCDGADSSAVAQAMEDAEELRRSAQIAGRRARAWISGQDLPEIAAKNRLELRLNRELPVARQVPGIAKNQTEGASRHDMARRELARRFSDKRYEIFDERDLCVRTRDSRHPYRAAQTPSGRGAGTPEGRRLDLVVVDTKLAKVVCMVEVTSGCGEGLADGAGVDRQTWIDGGHGLGAPKARQFQKEALIRKKNVYVLRPGTTEDAYKVPANLQTQVFRVA